MVDKSKGFTLIELLIVIAILAVLSVAVVLVLNPAEIIRQGRDSTRISDMAALNSAISLYLADVSSPNLGVCTSTIARVTSAAGGAATSTFVAVGGHTATPGYVSSTVVTGTGWIDVKFTDISAGSPLSREPIDPLNTGVYYYGYACTNGTTPVYELDMRTESGKFSQNGSSDVESKDGGDNPAVYEVGSSLMQ